MKNLKIVTLIAAAGLCANAIADGRHPHRGGRGHGHGHHPRPGHGHGHRHHNSDGELLSFGALLGSLAVSSTASAIDDAKEVLDRSDSIVEQILNHNVPEALYRGFRTEEEFRDLEDFEIDLLLLETLADL